MSTSTRRLGGLLDTYLRKRLSQNLHPAITLVRDHGEETSTFLQSPSEELQATSSNALVVRPQVDVVPASPSPVDDEDELEEVDLYDKPYLHPS